MREGGRAGHGRGGVLDDQGTSVPSAVDDLLEDPLATMLSSEFLDFEFDLGHSDDEGLPHQVMPCLWKSGKKKEALNRRPKLRWESRWSQQADLLQPPLCPGYRYLP